MSHEHERTCWIVGFLAAAVALMFSHTAYVTAQTYVCGVILTMLGVFLLWLRFRRTAEPRPKWLRVLSNSLLAIFCAMFLLYLCGVATWFE